MKSILISVVCSIFLLYSIQSYCETYSLDDEIKNEDLSMVNEEVKNDDFYEEKKSKIETNKYQYNVEIYPYVSMRYTNVTTIEENI